jgi:hypothetical protein
MQVQNAPGVTKGTGLRTAPAFVGPSLALAEFSLRDHGFDVSHCRGGGGRAMVKHNKNTAPTATEV